MQSDLSPNPIALIGAQTVARGPTVLPTAVGKQLAKEIPRKPKHRAERRGAGMPTRRSTDRAMAWWRQHRQHIGLWVLLASPVLLGFAGQQYFLHRQKAAPPVTSHAFVPPKSPLVGASAGGDEQASAMQGPVVAGPVVQPHASNLSEAGADGRVAASQVRTVPSNPTPVYEPAKLPPASPTPAATIPQVNLPPAANAAAAVPLPLPAPLQNGAKGRAMQTTPSGEDPAGVKVTLKGTPIGLSKATPQKAADAAPATPHETAASTATEVARPQVPPSTSQPS